MENYKIGIKLADGSFYPILEEGKPQVQTIELTTVRDDQTTVQLDLYRSSSDNMEDAEYVDTLLVENLLPRPKETPTLNLKIEIDSENVLSASIEDCESGEHSETKVSLVTLDSSERTIVPDFSMIETEDSDNINGDALLDEFADNTIATQEEVMDNELSKDDELNLDDFDDMDELITEDNSENVNNFVEESEVSEEIEAMPALDDMPDFAEDTVETSEEIDDMPELDIPVTDDIDESNGFQSDIMQDSILDNDFNSEESSLDEEEFPDFGDIATSEPEENQVDDDNDDGFFGIGNDCCLSCTYCFQASNAFKLNSCRVDI